MMKNIGQLMKQAQQMQQKMAEMQEQLASVEMTGMAGGGMVQVTLNGKGDAKRSSSTRLSSIRRKSRFWRICSSPRSTMHGRRSPLIPRPRCRS